MAGSAKDGRHGPIDPGALDDLLPVAIQMVAEMGDANEQDVSATLAKALRDPAFEGRLKRLLADEGASPEHQRVYLRMFAEWRRASEREDSAIARPGRSSKPDR